MTNTRVDTPLGDSLDCLARLYKISYDAYARFEGGLPIGDAVEGACAGHGLERFEIDVIEGQVIAKICRTAGDQAGALATLPAKIHYARVQGRMILPVLDRARSASLLVTEAAVLAAAIHYDPLWNLLEEIVDGGKGLVIGPIDRDDPGLANAQTQLARQICKTSLEERLVALVRGRSGDLDSVEVATLAAATSCTEIHDAIAQVRTVVVMTRAGVER